MCSRAARSTRTTVTRTCRPTASDGTTPKRANGSASTAAVSLIEVCDYEALKLAVDRIHYFSHWITPEGPPRRYDTRFFVARAPDKQVALHDDRETVANTWIRPQDALDAHERGEFEIIFPTIKNLSAIARFDDADELVAVAAKAETVPTVLPRIVQEGEQMRILLPGDPGY